MPEQWRLSDEEVDKLWDGDGSWLVSSSQIGAGADAQARKLWALVWPDIRIVTDTDDDPHDEHEVFAARQRLEALNKSIQAVHDG